ncbi:MAG: hypothetical protein HC895_08050 [Leptolyngbyaceae cyanobacterium SM1_3_5]|nr:hypothetical protein [Leptolyngbyaceae cyanobacterium SM1_3_5]
MNLKQRQRLLLVLVVVSIISTAFHYTDNFIFIQDYPQPESITPTSIYITWLILTTVGGLGYWLFQLEIFWLSLLLLAVYSLTGISSLAHYFYGAMTDFSPKMHLLIWTDGLIGFAILGFVVWSSLTLNKLSKPDTMH